MINYPTKRIRDTFLKIKILQAFYGWGQPQLFNCEIPLH